MCAAARRTFVPIMAMGICYTGIQLYRSRLYPDYCWIETHTFIVSADRCSDMKKVSMVVYELLY